MRPCESVIIFVTCALQVLILTAAQLRKCEVCFAGAAQMAFNGLIVPEETTCKGARKMLSMPSRRGGLAGGGIVQTLVSGAFHSFVPEAHCCPFELGGWVKGDFPCSSSSRRGPMFQDSQQRRSQTEREDPRRCGAGTLSEGGFSASEPLAEGRFTAKVHERTCAAQQGAPP